jgi:hypothetical protein
MKITKSRLRKIIKEKFSRDDFQDVYATAQMAHVGQTRRDGSEYFTHPSEVRNITARFYPKDRVAQLAALLHDTIEDAPGSTVDSPEEMEEFIQGSIADPASAQEVIRVVRALTHTKGDDYISYVVGLLGDQPTLRVKLSDMVHNLSDAPGAKQKEKYRTALEAIAAQTGGKPPMGISPKHWAQLFSLTEGSLMKITEDKLRQIIREEAKKLKENPAMQMMMKDRMRKNAGGKPYEEPKANTKLAKRKGSEPLTKAHVEVGAFSGTSTDRSKLNKTLRAQIEKMIASGKEDQVPSNWSSILGLSDGDHLLALQKAISPGLLKKIGRFLGVSEANTTKLSKEDLRNLVKNEIKSIDLKK